MREIGSIIPTTSNVVVEGIVDANQRHIGGTLMTILAKKIKGNNLSLGQSFYVIPYLVNPYTQGPCKWDWAI